MGKKGKGKSKNKPTPDTVFLYIESPFGMGFGADLRKRDFPLAAVCSWIHRLFPQGPPNALRIPDALWSRPKSTGIILPVPVPGGDHTQVEHLLGIHDWEKFVNPTRSYGLKLMGLPDARGQTSKVYLCVLNNEDAIATREFFRIDIQPPHPQCEAEFLPGPYPPPYLPSEAIPQSGPHLGLPAAPPETVSKVEKYNVDATGVGPEETLGKGDIKGIKRDNESIVNDYLQRRSDAIKDEESRTAVINQFLKLEEADRKPGLKESDQSPKEDPDVKPPRETGLFTTSTSLATKEEEREAEVNAYLMRVKTEMEQEDTKERIIQNFINANPQRYGVKREADSPPEVSGSSKRVKSESS